MAESSDRPGLARNVPCSLGAEMGRQLARLHDRARADLAFDRPDIAVGLPHRCGTCAFRAGTVPNRSLATVADALKCAVEGDPFLCHERVGDAEEADRLGVGLDGDGSALCMGWAACRLATGKGGDAGESISLPYDYSTQ